MSLTNHTKARVTELLEALERADPNDPRVEHVGEAVEILHSALTATNPEPMAGTLGTFNGELRALLTKWKILVNAHRTPQGAPIGPKVE